MYGENAVSEAFASSKEQLENQIEFGLPYSNAEAIEKQAEMITEGEMADWNSSLRTPPREFSLKTKAGLPV